MVKHTQTIRRQFADELELFDCVWPFCGIGTYELNMFLFSVFYIF